jgi:hypothetical protein
MGWRDLLEIGDERATLPWVGGRSLQGPRVWTIDGRLPPEHGWYSFALKGRKAFDPRPADPDPEVLEFDQVTGYLVGDHVVPDGVRCDPDPAKILAFSEKVYLLEPLDRFARVRAGRVFGEGPLIYYDLEFPVGPEEAVLAAYEDRKGSVTDIKEVTPALDAAFRMETFQRLQAEARRAELERLRRLEEERRAREERRRRLVERLGDGEGRREMAAVDFEEAARAALVVGGAELLDHRPHRVRGEHIVRYRLDRQRFECVCDSRLRIIDSGICLTDHRTNEKGDTYFTLESLPGVVRQAIREHKLVVYRHV